MENIWKWNPFHNTAMYISFSLVCVGWMLFYAAKLSSFMQIAGLFFFFAFRLETAALTTFLRMAQRKCRTSKGE